MMKKAWLLILSLSLCLFMTMLAGAEGQLPTLTNAYGVGMPSLTEALGRYPDSEEMVDDLAIESWNDITEEDFNTFGKLLKKKGWTLKDYTVEGSVFYATIAKENSFFTFAFDTDAQTSIVIYPKGTYDDRLYNVKSIWKAAEAAEKDGNYDEAAKKYASLKTYKGAKHIYRDSDEREVKCYYKNGEALRATQDWDGAVKAFKAAGTYSDAATQISETRYQEAKYLYDHGNYVSAYLLYKSISGYKDTDNLLQTDEHLLDVFAAREAKLKPFKTVGSIVTFGHYEQDNISTNGTEEIQWIVLDVQGGKSLLLSKYGLEAKPYNKEYENVTWETCTLRSWLNDDFLKDAFTTEEQSVILTTLVDNSSSQGYSEWSTKGGNNTQDKLFLLSYADANKYFNVTYEKDNDEAQLESTAYVIANGSYTTDHYIKKAGEKPIGWWLRSPGNAQYYAAFVFSFGKLRDFIVKYDDFAVRPAFWIDLESDIFY